MSWPKVSLLAAALVIAIFAAAVLSPPGYSTHGAVLAWAVGSVLVCVLPLDRR